MQFLVHHSNSPRIARRFCLYAACVALALAMVGCQPELYTGKLVGNGRPALQKDSPAVIFSMLVRKVAYANSNGLNWIARRTDDDYRNLYREITTVMTDQLQMQPIERTRVLDHALYQEGRFPLGKKFYLNTARLPIIDSATEEELMLRTSRALGVRYYVTVLAEHSVTKLVGLPATVTSVLVMNIYSADSGLIYQAELETSKSAEPYDRNMSLGELHAQYETVLAATLDSNITELLSLLRAKIGEEIRIVEPRPVETEGGDGSGNDGEQNDLGF